MGGESAERLIGVSATRRPVSDRVPRRTSKCRVGDVPRTSQCRVHRHASQAKCRVGGSGLSGGNPGRRLRLRPGRSWFSSRTSDTAAWTGAGLAAGGMAPELTRTLRAATIDGPCVRSTPLFAQNPPTASSLAGLLEGFARHAGEILHGPHLNVQSGGFATCLRAGRRPPITPHHKDVRVRARLLSPAVSRLAVGSRSDIRGSFRPPHDARPRRPPCRPTARLR